MKKILLFIITIFSAFLNLFSAIVDIYNGKDYPVTLTLTEVTKNKETHMPWAWHNRLSLVLKPREWTKHELRPGILQEFTFTGAGGRKDFRVWGGHGEEYTHYGKQLNDPTEKGQIILGDVWDPDKDHWRLWLR